MAKPNILIIMGSSSDMPKLEPAKQILQEFGIGFKVVVASAHRNPKKVMAVVKSADKNCDLIIAAAGMAAHLPGVVASHTTLPVIGVPIMSKSLSGFDALYSIVQMPSGIPVACVAIDGAKNAAILAAEILSLKYTALKTKLKTFRTKLAKR
ncbi:MAG: 5-(carboxyamino)imidazole ribonucleotide mutase [Candidatus Margulisbacteria bacterium]|nr:5-(carboxyamino)imidazole ribonucleotide mutase [Candidatus Margulisiibacteriota bacterium]MBU1021715.1 5-(carboxyamino)imidazole ribonucleotide mutase [Candidatus Margulisiibacteriota bacterium]MBU1729461.1 5-(carboxyamino)imidazole ribonucleotide mutase [Candidatus Margulisiibacteriota bacterium]MBU1955438.1 5-(carboxyamino)imidazole ribonucleotide mutase [Candidatus Margulisiibacteriota bacterium]